MAGKVQINKAHKTRFASKSSRQIHKTARTDKSRISKPTHNVGKAARHQRNKMVRDQKRAAVLKEKRSSSASVSPPRVIVLFGLSASVNVNELARELLKSLSPENADDASTTVSSPDYKLRATVLVAPHGDLLACMEMAKVADLIAFVASANTLCEEDNSNSYIDSFGTRCLSVFRALGLPSTVVFIRDLPVELKKRNELKKMCMSNLASEFPEDSKFYPADTKDELHKFLWLFKEQRITLPHWRSQRPYLMAQEVDLAVDDGNPGICTLLLSGYLRSRSLSVNQLVHVSGAGDFQLCKIDILKDPYPLNSKKDRDSMDSDHIHDLQVIRSLLPDPLKQEALLFENAPDPLAGEQTWPTEAEMTEADELRQQKKQKKKILPRGTSDYQAAWIVEDSGEEDSDSDDNDEDGMVLDGENELSCREDGTHSGLDEDQESLSLHSDGETETGTAMMDAENLTREQIEDEIRKIKEAHAEDEDFPDEVDAPLDVPARKRFAKYRGVKSFRTSSWDPKESLPPEYARIFAFDNFTRTQKHVLAKALEKGLVLVFPLSFNVDTFSKFSLSCSIKKHDSYNAPIKAKEDLIFHVGFRQFVARPIFSSDAISSDKHKMERFLHAGRFSIASVFAPISFPPLPLIVLKNGDGEVTPAAVAAVGSLRSIDPNRIILKKIILTGYPQRVSKLKATVRYMFHTPEDVRWFKPIEVWTKCGRRGRVKEPVGTHGAMKCIFNGIVQQHDTVCMSLFKRVYPKWPEQRYPMINA
ncbi:hypothetical protein IFM89_022946 [Coptis chinensis]|uniref:Bms1-type G domain-containing protein n=1 Tax=Coptis chinensis TaxID=261450 RepID=A0A835LN62_9MAGN|nr:hypothetical protein IFM89_022946 [Coptis chinensis]